jgi:outer membrane protein assembly factor BamB/tetratricopeptide (TPR) repeat protein
MSFKGDLSTIGLAEVFQMISMSQKEGTLVVQDHDSRKNIYFGPSGVRVISTGKRKGQRLGDLLLRTGRINEVQLSEALESAQLQKKLLGEVLVESGVVAEGDVQGVVRSQIEEEIYDLFLWKKADFEFIEGPPGEGLKDADANVTKLSFDVNGLLLEAVRRADEWSVINQSIPSLDSVFTFVSESDRNEEEGSAPDGLRRIYRLLDGQRTLSEIVDGSGVGKFDVCKAILDLVNRGRIRLLSVQEMMDLATRTLNGGDREKAVKMFMAIAAQAPGDGRIVSGVARVLENEGQTRDAAIHYGRAGRAYLEAGEADRARDAYRRAETLAPEDPAVKEGLFEVYASTGDLQQGKELARELTTAALGSATPDYPKALALCDRIVGADGADLEFRVLRARIYHRTARKRDLEGELDWIRKNMPADQKEAERIEKDILELAARAPTKATKLPTPKAKAPGGGRGKRRLLAAAALLLLAAAGGAGVFELKARAELDGRLAEADALVREEKFGEAKAPVEAFLGTNFRLSPMQRDRAERFLADLDQRKGNWEKERTDREEQRRKEAVERLKVLLAAAEEIRGREPAVALQRARDLRVQAETAKDADLVRRADELAATVERFLSNALKLKVDAEQLEREGKVREAALLIDRLLAEFPNTDAARGGLYPLEIVTRPKGVKVTSVRTGLVVGETSTGSVRHRMRAGESVRLLFEREGYFPTERDVKDKTQGRLEVHLDLKKAAWAKPLGIAVTGEPVVGGDALYVAGGSRVYSLQLHPFALRWSEGLEGPAAGSPRPGKGRLYVGTGNRAVVALDPANGARRVVWRVEVPDRVTATPGLTPDEALLLVPAGDLTLRALRASDGEEQWKASLPAEVRQEPVCVNGVIVAACSDGTVVGLRTAGGQEAWRIRADGPFGPLAVSGTMVYAASSDQHVYAIDAARGQRVWRRLLPSLVTGRPGRAGDLLAAAARDGKVYLLSAGTGEQIRVCDEAQGPIQGGVAVAGALVLFGSDDQWFYAYDTERSSLAWKLKSNGRIRLPPLVVGSRALFSSEDSLYSVDLD